MNKIIMLGVLVFLAFLFQSCAEKQDAGNIVARVGNDSITTEDLSRALQETPQPSQYEYLTDEGKRVFVEMMIDWKLMSREAVKAGLDREAEIKAELNSASGNSTINKEQVLGNAYVRYRIKQMERVTDAEVEKYYFSHKDEFKIPERIKVKRIIFDAKEKAQEAREAFKKGMLFEAYKQKNPGSRIKVDILWLQRRDDASEMERAAFRLAAGEMSEILAVNNGFCILRAEEKAPGRTMALAEIKGSLGARLLNERQQALIENIRRDLRKGLDISINTGVLESYQCKECAGRSAGGNMQDKHKP
jgi:peptidyl-prolyl cis-trans isomerase C